MKFISYLLDMLYPPKCPSCGHTLINQKYIFACEECIKKFLFIPSPKCVFCGTYLNIPGKICQNCLKIIKNKKEIWYNDFYSPFLYRDSLKNALHSVKYKRNINIAKNLGYYFAEILKKNIIFDKIDCVIAVPLHKNKKKDRGFNQSEIFAEQISKKLNIKKVDNVLKRIKNTVPQFTLDKQQRCKNVENAFVLSSSAGKIKNNSVLLVDDIFTTGSTINECAKTLQTAQASYIKAVTLAKT